jgi:hypothetical protein
LKTVLSLPINLITEYIAASDAGIALVGTSMTNRKRLNAIIVWNRSFT